MGVTPPSSWPGVGHVVSRLPPRTSARFGLGLPVAPRRRRLAGPGTASRRIIMQKARRHPARLPGHGAPTACRRGVSGSLASPRRGSSHRSLALLFAIGRRGVLSLAGWSPPLPAHFHVLGRTQDPARPSPASRTGLSPAAAGDSTPFRCALRSCWRSYNPGGRGPPVWAGPRSLAATGGVAVAFPSWGY